jgi:hypothetical protein
VGPYFIYSLRFLWYFLSYCQSFFVLLVKICHRIGYRKQKIKFHIRPAWACIHSRHSVLAQVGSDSRKESSRNILFLLSLYSLGLFSELNHYFHQNSIYLYFMHLKEEKCYLYNQFGQKVVQIGCTNNIALKINTLRT